MIDDEVAVSDDVPETLGEELSLDEHQIAVLRRWYEQPRQKPFVFRSKD